MIATLELPDNAAAIEAALEGLVNVDMLLIETGTVPPYPHHAGVIYQLEPIGEEDWKLAHNVIRDGWGDCEDLAAWVVAGLRVTGEDPGAFVALVQTGEAKLHAVVRRSDGSIDDPSADLRPKKVKANGMR